RPGGGGGQRRGPQRLGTHGPLEAAAPPRRRGRRGHRRLPRRAGPARPPLRRRTGGLATLRRSVGAPTLLRSVAKLPVSGRKGWGRYAAATARPPAPQGAAAEPAPQPDARR